MVLAAVQAIILNRNSLQAAGADVLRRAHHVAAEHGLFLQ